MQLNKEKLMKFNMFKKFNTAQDYTNFFHISKWKSLEEFFSYDKLYRKMSYETRDNLPSIGISCSVIGSVLLFIFFLASRPNPELGFLMYFTLVPIVAGLAVLTLKYWMRTCQIIFTFPFKLKFKRYMTEENLKDFVRIFTSDKYSGHRTKEKSYYNSLVLACHHGQSDFADIGGNILYNYYKNSSEQIKSDYDKEVLARFSQEKTPASSRPIMQDEKFMFMKE